MSGILDGLVNELGSDGISAIASKLGMDSSQTQSAIAGALPMIIGAMAHNASNPSGADALHNAVNQHASSGSILEQITQSVGASADGDAILGHIFGNRQQAATQGVSQTSGLNAGNAGALLSMLAPLVMNYLGRHASQNNMSSGQLSNSLGQQASQIQQDGGLGGSLLNAVLGSADKQGDGLDLGDILSAGSSILGAFNKR
ncbi:MAG TPA: DUF937 domain-containing protein [Rhodanobacteraceae bacterium]|nr:DUF937 domain-containing protein [Rhodanobacteraceae bacterium]